MMRGRRGVIDLVCIFPQEEATVIAHHESGDDDNFTQVGLYQRVGRLSM